MQPQTFMVVAVAILNSHVVAYLPTDTVAVVVPRDHLANRNLLAILHEDTAGVVAVEVFVVTSVAVEREIFDYHTGDVLARQQRKESRGGRLPPEP